MYHSISPIIYDEVQAFGTCGPFCQHRSLTRISTASQWWRIPSFQHSGGRDRYITVISGSAWSIEPDSGQPGWHNETMSQNPKPNKQNIKGCYKVSKEKEKAIESIKFGVGLCHISLLCTGTATKPPGHLGGVGRPTLDKSQLTLPEAAEAAFHTCWPLRHFQTLLTFYRRPIPLNCAEPETAPPPLRVCLLQALATPLH